jgi:preprotein translocase subunit SecB
MKSHIPSFSPVQLKGHCFPIVSIRANENARPTGKVAAEQQVGFLPVPNQPNHWNLQLQVKYCSADPSEPFSYDVEICAVGTVEIISDDIPSDKREKMAVVNGLAMLYGGCREMVLGITARSVYGSCSLPSVNFAQVIKEAEENQLAEHKAELQEKIAAV